MTAPHTEAKEEGLKVSENAPVNAPMKPKSNLHAWILWILGIILIIAGIAIVTIHSHLRGSGLGTALLILGFIVVIIGVVRYMYKPAAK